MKMYQKHTEMPADVQEGSRSIRMDDIMKFDMVLFYKTAEIGLFLLVVIMIIEYFFSAK
jgi:hypothetical protein